LRRRVRSDDWDAATLVAHSRNCYASDRPRMSSNRCHRSPTRNAWCCSAASPVPRPPWQTPRSTLSNASIILAPPRSRRRFGTWTATIDPDLGNRRLSDLDPYLQRFAWQWTSPSRSGRPRVPIEVRSLTLQMSMANMLAPTLPQFLLASAL